MNRRELQLAAIGTGGIWNAHARNLAALGNNRVVAVCDVNEENRNRAATALQARAYADVNELFAAESTLDGAIVCTPPQVRTPIIEAATKAGVPVLAEKPPAFDMDNARQMAQLVEQSGTPVFIGFHYRYLPAVQRLRELIANRPVLLTQSAFFCPAVTKWNLPPWFHLKERSGGHIVDQAIHVVDLLRYLVGDITQVHTLGNNLVRQQSETFTIEESSSTNFRFASGAVGSHVHSWVHSEFRGQITLIGEDYALTLELDSRLHGYIGEQRIDESFAEPPQGCSHHYEEMRSFLEALHSRDFSGLKSPFHDAAGSLAAVLAMNESIDSHGPVDVVNL